MREGEKESLSQSRDPGLVGRRANSLEHTQGGGHDGSDDTQ